jgi:hypothetical protein
MGRNRETEVDRHSGKGALSDAENHRVSVAYTIIHTRAVIEFPSLGGRLDSQLGTSKLSGYLTAPEGLGKLAFANDLTLELQDGRQLRIFFPRISDLRGRTNFVVSDARGYFSTGQDDLHS